MSNYYNTDGPFTPPEALRDENIKGSKKNTGILNSFQNSSDVDLNFFEDLKSLHQLS